MRHIVTVAAAAVLTVACSFQVVRTEGSIAASRDLGELVEQSDLIVVGTVEDTRGIRNLARLVSDTTREDPNVVVLGQDFGVQVETVLKGNVTPGTQIVVSLAKWHGVRDQAPGTDPEYVPFDTGARYVLFLKPLRDGTQAYGQGLEPFKFVVEDGMTRPESKWRDAGTYFPERSFAQLLSEVRAALK